MASDLAHAIVESAEHLRLDELKGRSRRLTLSRGTVKTFATFSGDGDDHVMVTLSMSGAADDKLNLRFRRTEGKVAFETCGQMMLMQLWTTEFDTTEILADVGAPVKNSIHFNAGLSVFEALSLWRIFRTTFNMLMHVL